MDRLLKENAGLREERAKQEHKIQQIIKSASQTKARLLALKAEKSGQEFSKEGGAPQRAELENLEKQLAALKETFLGNQEKQREKLAELTEALSESRKAEAAWAQRAKDLKAEVTNGSEARENLAMQVTAQYSEQRVGCLCAVLTAKDTRRLRKTMVQLCLERHFSFSI